MIRGFTFEEVLILPEAVSVVESRSDVDCTFRNIARIPVIPASMSVFDMRDGKFSDSFISAAEDAGLIYYVSRAVPLDIREYFPFISVGLNETPNTGVWVGESYIPRFSIDIANGALIDQKAFSSRYMRGNFGVPLRHTPGYWYKYGIGSGGACSTRLKTGVGAPQGWLVQEAAARKNGATIISDGGINNIGDICKALALGADMVMTGKLFAAAKETPQEAVKFDGKWYKPYWGMSSAKEKGNNTNIEGVSGYVPYEGKSLEDIVTEIEEGIKSFLSYINCFTLETMYKHPPTLITNSPYESTTRLHGT